MKISRHCQRRRLEPLFESRERVVQVSSTEKRIEFRLKTDGLHATCRHSRQTASAPLSRRGTAGSLRLCAGDNLCRDFCASLSGRLVDPRYRWGTGLYRLCDDLGGRHRGGARRSGPAVRFGAIPQNPGAASRNKAVFLPELALPADHAVDRRAVRCVAVPVRVPILGYPHARRPAHRRLPHRAAAVGDPARFGISVHRVEFPRRAERLSNRFAARSCTVVPAAAAGARRYLYRLPQL